MKWIIYIITNLKTITFEKIFAQFWRRRVLFDKSETIALKNIL